jgi:hypothetical protein
MKKLLISLVTVIALLAGCNQSVSQEQGDSPEDLAKIAYQWEKAKFDNDYDKQQEFLYEEGSYEVDKGAEKKNSGLKYEDMSFEIYYDEELKHYFVFADFKNPQGDNTVHDELVFRKEDDKWKLDQNQSLKVNREDIKLEFERSACINCK